MKFFFMFLLSILLFAQADDRGVRVSSKMQSEQRVALVMGNNEYGGVLSKLRNPINDAKSIRDILESRGFEVIYKENSTKRDMRATLNKFYEKIREGGVGLFYFSGHGIEVDGQNYLIPIDAKLDEKSDAEFEAVSLNKITKKMQNARNRLNIVVLDACRNDPFSRSAGTGGLAKAEPIGLFVSYSTGAGSVASDGKSGENGLFTKYLVKNMKRSLDLQNVFHKTREDVYIASNQKQFPAIYNQTINGKFYFTVPKGRVESKHESRVVESTPVVYVPKMDSFVKTIIDDKLKDRVSVANSSSRVKNGSFQVVLDIQNHQSQKVSVNYRYKWFDDEGFEVGENMSIWQPLFLESNDNSRIKGIAPVPTATSCKFYLK
ncbi:DUF1425 domain-containing protein [Sulfurovum sp. bin170]|uniref:DUF1425 domain-containing protein n=1 Tax=Sulfurovum sp. bin170 TaxID=2695268 RepID=UPI0013DF5706|nr:DUF1425 domain-containing protein [Sulfurovum sp. bin170]NEW60373.1 DUF1425 domain-containing protein [Sulfurovum sp. bin170]